MIPAYGWDWREDCGLWEDIGFVPLAVALPINLQNWTGENSQGLLLQHWQLSSTERIKNCVRILFHRDFKHILVLPQERALMAVHRLLRNGAPLPPWTQMQGEYPGEVIQCHSSIEGATMVRLSAFD
jgi:hypothetical protein